MTIGMKMIVMMTLLSKYHRDNTMSIIIIVFDAAGSFGVCALIFKGLRTIHFYGASR